LISKSDDSEFFLQNGGISLLLEILQNAKNRSIIKNGTSTLVSFCSKLLFALKMDPDLVKKIIFLFAKVMSNEDDEEVSGFAIQAVNHLLFAYKSHIHEIKKWTIDSGLLHQLLMTLKRLFSHFHFIYSYICI